MPKGQMDFQMTLAYAERLRNGTERILEFWLYHWRFTNTKVSLKFEEHQGDREKGTARGWPLLPFLLCFFSSFLNNWGNTHGLFFLSFRFCSYLVGILGWDKFRIWCSYSRNLVKEPEAQHCPEPLGSVLFSVCLQAHSHLVLRVPDFDLSWVSTCTSCYSK